VIGSLLKLLGHPLSQEVPRDNAQQSAMRLARRRRQREDVEAYLSALEDEPRQTRGAQDAPA
jgi:hypothetical protein